MIKNNEQRINNIIGQLEGIKKMLALENRNCSDLIIQIKAVKSAVSSLMEKILMEEMDSCFATKKVNQSERMVKLLKELTNKY